MSIKMNIKEINWVTTWQHSCINRECPICRNSTEGTENIVINSCGHGFHLNCITSWHNQINYNKKCPVCNNKWKEKLYNNSNNLST